MSGEPRPPKRIEEMLADLLGRGTFLASMVIAVGIAVVSTQRSGEGTDTVGARIIKVGIALFIALPVLRLLLMLAVFLRQRDYRFVAITAAVLTIICLGLALGMWMSTSK